MMRTKLHLTWKQYRRLRDAVESGMFDGKISYTPSLHKLVMEGLKKHQQEAGALAPDESLLARWYRRLFKS